MHFKETVTMDMAESFRHTDVSKTDFFELVTSPELTDAQFKQQMRSVNVFLESTGGGNPLISGEPRNAAPPPNPPPANPPLQSFDSIWNADRERDRLETAILEDLNKFYWSQETEREPDSPPGAGGAGAAKADADNTDGQIYTLTVLDGEAGAAPWERPERRPSPAPADPADLRRASLDLDSILSIIPTQMNGFGDAFLPDPLVKEEPFGFDDGGFGDRKDALDNNNDWKLADQNGCGESLLRSALQGRGTRYAPRASPPAPPPPARGRDRLAMALDADGGVEAALYESAAALAPERDDPPSAQSVDDIILSQLDSAYPDDYDCAKFGGMAGDVVDSVRHFCNGDVDYGVGVGVVGVDAGVGVGAVAGVGAGLAGLLPPRERLQPAASPAVSSTKTVAKKYKRSGSRGQGQGQGQAQGQAQGQQLGGGSANPGAHAATSTSNGIRKERSLHYCSICSKGFKDKYSVNVHIRTHTGEKPFACSLCGKSFRQKAHLAKHYQTHIAQKNAAAAGAVKAAKQR